MEFYKLFHKRTNYYSLLEWIDRGFRPDRYELRVVLLAELFGIAVRFFSFVGRYQD